jgi:hypothetical protein
MALAHLLASFLACDASVDPAVTLKFNNLQPTLDLSQSSEALHVYKDREGSSPNYKEFDRVRGLTNGIYQFQATVDFTNTEWPLFGKSCVYPTVLEITATYKPTISLSNDIVPGSCMYNMTLEHEMKHIQVDINTLNEFIPSIKKIGTATLAMNLSKESIDTDKVADRQKEISDKVAKALNDAGAKLQEARILRQQSVDTREEYTRLSNICPGQ